VKTLEKKCLFWDVNLKQLSPQKHRQFIIERILAFGDIEDFNWALSYYGYEGLKQGFLKSKTLDLKSQNFWCLYFGVKHR
jgi:hypothetical protein